MARNGGQMIPERGVPVSIKAFGSEENKKSRRLQNPRHPRHRQGIPAMKKRITRAYFQQRCFSTGRAAPMAGKIILAPPVFSADAFPREYTRIGPDTDKKCQKDMATKKTRRKNSTDGFNCSCIFRLKERLSIYGKID